MGLSGWLLAASIALAVDAPLFDASDPSAPAVTADTLLANERFWPYQVELTASWTPPGQEKALPARTRAVLVRVEESGMLRVDFGRDGRFEVPVEVTDVVASANQIRLGTVPKTAPNFVLAIGPRLADTSSGAIQPVPFDEVYEPRGFISVFAAPDRLEELAEALAPLHLRHGTWTILFPQAFQSDPEIRRTLRSLEWPVPFVLDRFSEGYTRSRLGEEAQLPAVMLQTPEGRVLYEAVWDEGVATALGDALDAAYGQDSASR